MDNILGELPLLASVDFPEDLRQLQEEQLPQLADECRQFIIQTLNQCGGHFAAGLGSVELTIALHYLYNTPDDRLVWDVGHQAYPHKILTGRKHLLHTVRQFEGLAPFPKRGESPYDCFSVGHASTSIGAALGMAMSNRIANNDRRTVAIIGDGAMTAGMAFEAMNHAGDLKDTNLLVILNDNEMSISRNVGALSNYFARVMSGKFYTSVKEGSKKVLEKIPSVWEFARRTESHMKGMIVPGTLFEELGFNYIGPIDGHDLPTLTATLRNLRAMQGPQFLHVVTRKGKGFAAAEEAPITYHAVKPNFLKTEAPKQTVTPSKPTYSNVFGDWLCDMAAEDPRLVGITPAMREGSDLIRFSEQFPDRYVDVGIAEQHAVTVAGGLAAEGMKPVVAIYSSFLQRGYDQLIHDVALQNVPVLFALDRAGLVGGDGSTHQGAFDLSYLRCVPNMVIMAPTDENECRQMLYTGFCHDGPCVVRYPRGTGPGAAQEKTFSKLPMGKAEVRRQGNSKIALLAFGSMLTPAMTVAERLDATVVNMRFVKPLDVQLIRQFAKQYHMLVTLEENVIQGGAGSGVNEVVVQQDSPCKVLNLGLPDEFVEHGDPKQLLADCKLDADNIEQAILSAYSSLSEAQEVTPSLSS